jgi:hypothetical protein
MIDRAATTEPTDPLEGAVREPPREREAPARQDEAPAGPPALTTLEERVRRLEDAVAGLQDTRQLEDRVVERLADRSRADLATNATGIMIEAGRHLLPTPPLAERASDGATAQPPPAAAPSSTEGRQAGPPLARPARRPWLLFDLYADVRATMYMFVDPRYRMTWTGRFLPWVLLFAILSSWYWIPFVLLLRDAPLVGGFLANVIVKLVDLILAFVLFKVLGREATRYRETSRDLPSSLRL